MSHKGRFSLIAVLALLTMFALPQIGMASSLHSSAYAGTHWSSSHPKPIVHHKGKNEHEKTNNNKHEKNNNNKHEKTSNNEHKKTSSNEHKKTSKPY